MKAADGMTLMTSQVMQLTGATKRQLEHWDKIGLTNPLRTGHNISNDRRLYTEDDVARIRDILLLRELDVSLPDIKAILDAPEDERRERMAACTVALKSKYDRVSKQVALSTVVETQGIEAVSGVAARFVGPEALEDSFARDENLQQMTRWMKSHTPRDVERFASELGDVATAFAALPEDAEWPEVELLVARFCDVWGERLGWPSVGQMLQLHGLFASADAQASELGELLGAEAMEAMADMFLLAWASAGLESLDEILACLYKGLLDSSTTEGVESCVQNAAEVLCALVAELGGDAHVHDWQPGEARTGRLRMLAEKVLGLLVSVALDDELGDFLDLDSLATIDADAVEAARNMIEACAENRLQKWLGDGGMASLNHLAEDWLETLFVGWLQWAREDPESGFGEDSGEAELTAGFAVWLESWFAETYPDAPEAAWTTEDESCARERTMRELLEQAKEGEFKT